MVLFLFRPTRTWTRLWWFAPGIDRAETGSVYQKVSACMGNRDRLCIIRHSPDSCRVVRQFAPFPRFRQSCAVGAGCRWGWNEPAACRALKITEFSVIEAHLSREFGSDA